MINARTIKKLAENDGLTLKNGKPIQYKSGWQVADYGEATTDPYEASRIVRRMNGNCGIWLEKGIYYIDHSFRVDTKKRHWKLENCIIRFQFSVGRRKTLHIAKVIERKDN